MSLAPEPTESLARLIARDLVSVGRVPSVLLVLVLVSALGVVLITPPFSSVDCQARAVAD